MEAPRLEWSASTVRDSTLTVPIVGDRPKGWKSSFDHTVRLLGGGAWGDVSLKKTKVTVADVPEGSEEELRFFLESVVQEANAAHVPAEDEDGEPPEHDDGDGDDDDGRMTSRFRDFAAD